MKNYFYTKMQTKDLPRYACISIITILSLFVTSANAQVEYSNGGVTNTVATLKLAFDAVNAGSANATGTVLIEIVGNTTETVSASLNASGVGLATYSSILIRPKGGAARTISGNFTGHLINFQGADNVTIDGLNTGGNSLTISNANVGASSAIRLIADATNNIIRNCSLQASSTGTSGVIFFSTGTTSGNDNNNVNNCNIGPAGANNPVIGILSFGSTSASTNLNNAIAINNSNNTIDNNNIFDFGTATVSAQGININNGNSTWTVTNNRIYQTTTRTYTAAVAVTGMSIGGATASPPASGDGYIITGNRIGFANSGGTGTMSLVGNSVPLAGFPASYVPTGTPATLTFRGIVVSSNAGAPTSITQIQNNTIAGIAMYTSSSQGSFNPLIGTGGTLGIGALGGIVISGTVNCGTTTANTIGSASGTGSIYLVSTTAGVSNNAVNTCGTICGIFAQSTSAVLLSKCRIENNIMGGWDAMGSTSAICGGITGVLLTNSADYDVLNNTIGNSTNPNMRMGTLTDGGGNLSNVGSNFGISTGKGEYRGILNITSSTTNVVFIGKKGLGNIIQNASLNSTNSISFFKGIEGLRNGPSGSGNLFARHGIVEGNEIRFLTTRSSSTATVADFNVTGVGNADLAGIGIYDVGSTEVNMQINNNYIHDLSLTNTGTGGYNLAGIVLNIPLGTTSAISKNKICALSNASTSASTTAPGIVSGIYLPDGNATPNTLSNNMISLGSGLTTNTAFIGVWAAGVSTPGSPLKLYHNTINIAGSASSGAQPSFAFIRGNFSAVAVNDFVIDARNNILVNTRSGGTGKHYAIANNFGAAGTNVGWGVNASDYNILNANAATIGFWAGDKTFATWKTASNSEAHSFSNVTVTFVGPCDLHLNMGVATNFIESQAITGTGITDDIDDQSRPGPASPVNGGSVQPDIGADEFDGSPIFPPTITIVTNPTGNNCGASSHLVQADIIPVTGSLTTITLYWDNGTPGSATMTLVSGNTYQATIPSAGVLATTVTWRIEAFNTGGVSKTYTGTPYSDNIPPASPTTTNYAICSGGSVPSGQGLTATCVTGGVQTINVNLTTPVIDETATGTQGVSAICPGNAVIGSFVIPPAPSGAVITSARLIINGVTLQSIGNFTSYANELGISFSGTGIVGGGTTDCFQGNLDDGSPPVTNWAIGGAFFPLDNPLLGDPAILGAAINRLGGTITITYNEFYNDIPGGPDALFPPTATFEYTTSLPATTVNWYTVASGPPGVNFAGSGSPFDPITAGAIPNTPGSYTLYARCIDGNNCESSVGTAAVFSIGQPLAVSATSALAGNICQGTPDQLTATASSGGFPYSYLWSPSAGLDNTTISNPVATPTATTVYTVKVTDNCNNTKTATVTVTIIPTPTTDVTPRTVFICRATGGPVALTATGATTYSWSPAAGLSATTGSVVNAFPLVNTVYVVTGSFANGCTMTANANVFSDDKPNIIATATPSNVCVSPNSSTLAVSTIPTYCIPQNTGFGNGFRQITLNTLNSFPPYPPLPTVPLGYNVNAPVGNNTTTLVAGQSYNLTAATAIGVADLSSVWIDFDHDGVFEIDEWDQISAGAATATVSVAVPLTAINGLTKMRLRQRNFANDAFSSCIAWASGSTEDYMITITGGVNEDPLASYAWSPSTFLNNSTIASPTATNVTATTTYTVTVTNAAGCVNSSSVTVSRAALATAPTASQVITYCANTNNTGGASGVANTIFISNVTFGTGPAINNTTPVGSGFNIYALPNPTIPAGSVNPISVTTTGIQGISVWIDYNQNGNFEAFELAYHDFTNIADQVYTSNITIPATAFNGLTRMRIRTLRDGDPSVVSTPGDAACFAFVLPTNLFADGETEDYYLTISGGVTHTNPCSGATYQLEANATGGGTPFTYSWAPAGSLSNATFSSPIATVTTSTTYTVTVGDICGNTTKSTVSIILSPPPVVSVSSSPSNSAICTSGSVTLTAAGADFYTWAPSTGLNSTNTAVVIASPTTTTYYVVTGSQGGCTTSVTAPVVFFDPLVVEPTADLVTGCSPFSTTLHANMASSSLLITEVVLLRDGTGATSPYPAFVSAVPLTDYIEISNVSNSAIDISGYSFADYPTSSTVANHPYTFLPGTIIPANSVLVLHLGDAAGAADSPANRYYNTGGTTNLYLSTDAAGFVLMNGATVVDAVGMGAGFVFAPGTGVTAADWNGVAPSAANFAGCIRASQFDTNTGNDWNISGAPQQNVGTYSPGTNSISSYVWTPSTGLSSTTVENPTVTNLSSNTTYTVSVTNSYGCTATGSITLFANPTPSAPTITPSGTTTFCQGGSVGLTASSANVSPTYTWSPAAGLSSTVGTSVTASPTVTTTYTLTVSIQGGCTAISTLTVNVNFANTPNITGGPTTFCQGGNVNLNASAPGPYTAYSWSNGTSIVSTNSTYLASTSGTYTVTVTAPNTCTTTASKVVVVNPNPPAPVVTLVGTLPICDNVTGSVLLDASVSGGGYSYLWDNFGQATTQDYIVYGSDQSFLFYGNPNTFTLTITDGNGCIATSNGVQVTTTPCGVTLDMKMYIQGFYNASSGLMDNGGVGCYNLVDPGTYPDPADVDDVTITAMDEFTFLPVEAQVGRLKVDGTVSVFFSGSAVAGNNYYLKITHRNVVETWSKNPVPFVAGTTTYDFTTASTQAFDDGFNIPMKLVSSSPVRWAFYNGDIDQDGGVTSLDMTLEENDANVAAFGFQASDLDGDGSSGSLDMTIIENNSNANIYTVHP